jgi:type II secretion system protein I
LRPNHSAGFTLLEVMIALAIMTVSFASILSIQSSSINATTRAKTVSTVAMLARNQMIEAEFKFQGKKFEEMKTEETGRFNPPFQDYEWKTVVKEVNFPNLTALEGGGSGSEKKAESTEGSEQMAKMVTQFMSKALREVTVTVTLKQGGREQSYSLSTYWVDLNHEIQL